MIIMIIIIMIVYATHTLVVRLSIVWRLGRCGRPIQPGRSSTPLLKSQFFPLLGRMKILWFSKKQNKRVLNFFFPLTDWFTSSWCLCLAPMITWPFSHIIRNYQSDDWTRTGESFSPKLIDWVSLCSAGGNRQTMFVEWKLPGFRLWRQTISPRSICTQQKK